MKEGPKILIAATTTLLLAFGAGVGVGWATRERPPATETSAASVRDPREVRRDLAACRRALAARSQARAAPGATHPEAAEFEAQERKLQECRRNELSAQADVCTSIERHAVVMRVLINSAASCADEALVGDFINENFKACGAFVNIDDTLDFYELTGGQKRRVTHAALIASRYKGTTPDVVTSIVESCMARSAREPGETP